MLGPSNRNERSTNLPMSAYRWNLLDSVEQDSSSVKAVFEHKSGKVWCSIFSFNIKNGLHIKVYSDVEYKDYISTDLDCLTSLISSILGVDEFHFHPPENGDVKSAYEFIK